MFACVKQIKGSLLKNVCKIHQKRASCFVRRLLLVMVFQHVRAAREGCFTDSGQDAKFCIYVSENNIQTCCFTGIKRFVFVCLLYLDGFVALNVVEGGQLRHCGPVRVVGGTCLGNVMTQGSDVFQSFFCGSCSANIIWWSRMNIQCDVALCRWNLYKIKSCGFDLNLSPVLFATFRWMFGTPCLVHLVFSKHLFAFHHWCWKQRFCCFVFCHFF